jgi:hypothetical protein
MDYVRVSWLHDVPHEPIELFREIDAECGTEGVPEVQGISRSFTYERPRFILLTSKSSACMYVCALAQTACNREYV